MTGTDDADVRGVPRIVAELTKSRKYGNLCQDTLYRAALWAHERHSSQKEAVKAAKRKLHQACGAYIAGFDAARLEKLAQQAADAPTLEVQKSICRQILAAHVSTVERLPLLVRIFDDLFSAIGKPRSILDLACGLHPFSLPWMALDPSTVYRAWDIDHRIVALINRFGAFGAWDLKAEARDVLCEKGSIRSDLVLLLKSLPCLERQAGGASLDLLGRIRAPYIVVSYPSRSLGGKSKGMEQEYDRQMAEIADQLGVTTETFHYPGETYHVVETGE